MRRHVAALLLALVTMGVASVGPATAAEPTTTTTTEVAPAPDIIPEPNSGSAPEDPGDRGGLLQTVLFVAILAGIGGIGVLVVRESRRTREQRGF